MVEMRNAYEIFVEKTEENSAFGRYKRRWENNIRMDFRVIKWEGVDWIDLGQERDQ
jgi:hypothetical protein